MRTVFVLALLSLAAVAWGVPIGACLHRECEASTEDVCTNPMNPGFKDGVFAGDGSTCAHVTANKDATIAKNDAGDLFAAGSGTCFVGKAPAGDTRECLISFDATPFESLELHPSVITHAMLRFSGSLTGGEEAEVTAHLVSGKWVEGTSGEIGTEDNGLGVGYLHRSIDAETMEPNLWFSGGGADAGSVVGTAKLKGASGNYGLLIDPSAALQLADPEQNGDFDGLVIRTTGGDVMLEITEGTTRLYLVHQTKGACCVGADCNVKIDEGCEYFGGLGSKCETPCPQVVACGDDPLPILQKLAPTYSTNDGNAQLFDMRVQERNHRFHSALPESKVYAINGQVPGPIVEMRACNPEVAKSNRENCPIKTIRYSVEPCTHIIDNIPENCLAGYENLDKAMLYSNLHFGQLVQRSESKLAHPLSPAVHCASEPFEYKFPVHEQLGGAGEYRDNLIEQTRYAGVQGIYKVRAFEEEEYDIPKGENEIDLLLSAVRISEKGELEFAGEKVLEDFKGDIAVVNGAHCPRYDMPTAGWKRFNLVNGAPREWDLQFSNKGAPLEMLAIAGESFYPRAEQLQHLKLAEGEHVSVLVYFQHDANIVLENLDKSTPLIQELMQINAPRVYGKTGSVQREFPQFESQIQVPADAKEPEKYPTRDWIIGTKVDGKCAINKWLINEKQPRDECIEIIRDVKEVWQIMNTALEPITFVSEIMVSPLQRYLASVQGKKIVQTAEAIDLEGRAAVETHKVRVEPGQAVKVFADLTRVKPGRLTMSLANPIRQDNCATVDICIREPTCEENGECEPSEDCSCADCQTATTQGPDGFCGDGICQTKAATAEDCTTCPEDCPTVGMICCGSGGSCNPSCKSCTDQELPKTCCGDGKCTGAERDPASGVVCRHDCPAPLPPTPAGTGVPPPIGCFRPDQSGHHCSPV